MLRSFSLAGLLLALTTAASAAPELLNASFDVARPFYKAYNAAFAAEWKRRTGIEPKLNVSHGGSAKQARSVIDGLEADVVTMNSPLDIDAIAARGLIAQDWPSRFPHAASPSWSAILFVVRKGNPKGIRDWADLVKPGVSLVIPNPKTSGNGRYSYLAAWQYARTRPGGSDDSARAFVKALFAQVPVLDTGGRGASSTFAQRGAGDVLLTFESEIALLREEFPVAGFEVVVPSLTVRADNPVAVVDAVAARHGSEALARAYLDYHYSPQGQALFAEHGVRPADAAVLKAHAARFPTLTAFTIEQGFGSWAQAQSQHFADGAVFDQIIARR